MVSTNQTNTINKQHILAPKITQASTQQTSMFVPITMANNVSVLTNQAPSLMTGKRVGQLGQSTTLRIQQQVMCHNLFQAISADDAWMLFYSSFFITFQQTV